MAKKQKNTKHTEAIRRKIDAANEMAKFGLKLDDDQVILGFLFSHLAMSHLTYFGINSINQFCNTQVGIDICIFSQHIIAPCITPLCPVFGTLDLARWKNYPLITTSIGTTIEALSSNASTIYHYAFDPEFIGKSHKESFDLQPAFCDPRVRTVVRHESHKELIESEFGIQVCDEIIPNCNVELLAKLVLTEMKNGGTEITHTIK